MKSPTANSGMSALTSPPNATSRMPAASIEHEDAVREHEPVATVGELPRQEPVARDDARQAREVGERGVGRQREDRRRRRLEQHVERTVAEDLAAHDRQERLVGAQRRAQMEASTAIPRNSVPRITATQVKVMAAFRDSGFRNAWMPFEIASTPLSATAPDENARSSKKADAAGEQRVRAGEVLQGLVVDGESAEVAGRDPDQPDDDEQRHHDDVRVRRRGEQASRLSHAAQVGDGDQREQREARAATS